MALNCWLLRSSPGIASIAVPCAREAFAVTPWPGHHADTDVTGVAAADPNPSPDVGDREEGMWGQDDAVVCRCTGV